MITGFGHGSREGKAKLKPLVENYLKDNNIKFQIAADEGSYEVWFN